MNNKLSTKQKLELDIQAYQLWYEKFATTKLCDDSQKIYIANKMYEIQAKIEFEIKKQLAK
jgi:hypothetical protein